MKRMVIGFITGAAVCCLISLSAYAGQWKQDDGGWWYQNEDGSYPAAEWKWIDSDGDGVAECYYFYSDGYMAYNNDIENQYLNDDGQWVLGNVVQKRYVNAQNADANRDPGKSTVGISLEPYRKAIHDKSIIEQSNYFSYLKRYFQDAFGFQKYYLHDLNADGIPELFVYSDSMGLTAVYTIDQDLKYLGYVDIYGINPRTKRIVVHGHWHGAGGSGENEWSTHQMINGELEFTSYYDYMPSGNSMRYTSYDPKTENYNNVTADEYNTGVKELLNGCYRQSYYKMYNLGDDDGLTDVQ